jgi:hypothetical protein
MIGNVSHRLDELEIQLNLIKEKFKSDASAGVSESRYSKNIRLPKVEIKRDLLVEVESFEVCFFLFFLFIKGWSGFHTSE